MLCGWPERARRRARIERTLISSEAMTVALVAARAERYPSAQRAPRRTMAYVPGKQRRIRRSSSVMKSAKTAKCKDAVTQLYLLIRIQRVDRSLECTTTGRGTQGVPEERPHWHLVHTVPYVRFKVYREIGLVPRFPDRWAPPLTGGSASSSITAALGLLS